MDQKLIERINELAKKAKTIGLNEEEIKERELLRQRYLQSFRSSFKNQLDSIKFTDDNESKPH